MLKLIRYSTRLLHISADEECCYFYGSVPRNDSNCIPEGTQLNLNFIVINPRDNFTNLTVKWFRNADIARAATATEELTNIQHEHYLIRASTSSLTIGNCTAGPLYRDLYALVIRNFTSDKNGYYWCQIVVNGSVSQPSQYAWFYAADSSSCRQQSHFKQAIVPECAEFHRNIYTTSIITDPVSISTLETPYPSYTTSMGTSIIKPKFSKTVNQSKSFPNNRNNRNNIIILNNDFHNRYRLNNNTGSTTRRSFKT